MAVRAYTTQSKEIKFTSFLMDKIQEKLGEHILKRLEESFDLYLDLSIFVQEMAIDKMLSTTSEDLVSYALNLGKEAAVHESLRDC